MSAWGRFWRWYRRIEHWWWTWWAVWVAVQIPFADTMARRVFLTVLIVAYTSLAAWFWREHTALIKITRLIERGRIIERWREDR